MTPGSDVDEGVARRILWALPTGLYLVGSVGTFGSGPWNLMTINQVTQVATNPPRVALSLEHDSVTADLVAQSGRLSLSLLSREHRAIVRRFVKPVESVVIDSDGRVTMSGEGVVLLGGGGPPVYEEAAAWLELEVRNALDLQSHVLVVAEVVGAGAQAAFLEGRASERKFEVLRMEDTRMNYGG